MNFGLSGQPTLLGLADRTRHRKLIFVGRWLEAEAEVDEDRQGGGQGKQGGGRAGMERDPRAHNILI